MSTPLYHNYHPNSYLQQLENNLLEDLSYDTFNSIPPVHTNQQNILKNGTIMMNLDTNYNHPNYLQINTDYQTTSNNNNNNNNNRHDTSKLHNNLNQTNIKIGIKRSREELNIKEKERMNKINYRIQELRKILEDAGLPTKKSKQSVLDNISNYIHLLKNQNRYLHEKVNETEKKLEEIKNKVNKDIVNKEIKYDYDKNINIEDEKSIDIDLIKDPLPIPMINIQNTISSSSDSNTKGLKNK